MANTWSFRQPSIGDLRCRVTIQRQERVSDGRGGWRTEWVDAGSCWAAISALRPYERILAQQTQAAATHQVVIRYRTDLTAAMRLVYNGRYLYLQGPPVDPDGRRRWLQILCEERAE